MFERFTERARRVMALALQEAFVLQHESVDVPHVALGLIREGAGVGAQILRNLNVDGQAVGTRLLSGMPKGREYAPKAKLPQTQAAKQLIMDAIEEAKSLGHGYVGTEHMLLGLLRSTGLTADVFGTAGATLVRARAELKTILAHWPEAERRVAPDDIARDGLRTAAEHFSSRARKVMALANEEAQRFQHEYVGTEHILLGIVKEGTGLGASALKQLGLDLRKVRLEVERVVKVGPEPVPMGALPRTPRATLAIKYAIEESRALVHSSIGTEHLLLGLLRESEGVAAMVLTRLGVALDHARAAVLKLLGSRTDEEEPPSSPPRDDCDLCRRLFQHERWPHSEVAVMPETTRCWATTRAAPAGACSSSRTMLSILMTFRP